MDTKRIGKFISENRKRKGLTQEQLGELLGVTNKTISRWENGNYMPDLSLLVPLSETLDISLNELLNGKYITEDKIMETTEKSLKNTINYSKNMLVQEKRKISIGIMIFLNCKMKLELRNWDKGACPFIPIRAAAGSLFSIFV